MASNQSRTRLAVSIQVAICCQTLPETLLLTCFIHALSMSPTFQNLVYLHQPELPMINMALYITTVKPHPLIRHLIAVSQAGTEDGCINIFNVKDDELMFEKILNRQEGKVM